MLVYCRKVVSGMKRRDCPEGDTCLLVRGEEGSRACGSCNGPVEEDVPVEDDSLILFDDKVVESHDLVVCPICGLSHPVGTGYCTTYGLSYSWNRRHELGVAAK